MSLTPAPIPDMAQKAPPPAELPVMYQRLLAFARTHAVDDIDALVMRGGLHSAVPKLYDEKTMGALQPSGDRAAAVPGDPRNAFLAEVPGAGAIANAITGLSPDAYRIASEAQPDLSALAEQAWASYTQAVAAWAEKAAEIAKAAEKARSTIAATTAAFDQLSKATKQVVTFADASVRAAAKQAAEIASHDADPEKSKTVIRRRKSAA